VSHRSSDRPIVILGAGLSGLSLACALCEQNYQGPVLLIDRRQSWERDRTWCTWLTEPLRFSDCVTHRWPAWRTRTPAGQTIASSRRHPYVHIDAERVYEAALGRIARAPNLELCPGESVRSVETGETGDVLAVHTSDRTVAADLVFDALGPSSPLGGRRAPGSIEFAQRFVGWEVEVDAPVFDPGTATLMDFRPHAGVGSSFIYVLPFSPTRALVEHTSIEPREAPAVDRDAALAQELQSWGVADWQVLRRERALIPMTTFRFPAQRAPGLYTLGAAAGAIRPSSGYAFTRIQRHASQIAVALVAQRPPPARVSRPRHDLLDRVFLHALAHTPGPEALFLAAATAPGDVFARFMTDTSTLRDEARIIAALPAAQMARAAWGAIAASRASVLHSW
jgi:lycopene beta-cyclase